MSFFGFGKENTVSSTQYKTPNSHSGSLKSDTEKQCIGKLIRKRTVGSRQYAVGRKGGFRAESRGQRAWSMEHRAKKVQRSAPPLAAEAASLIKNETPASGGQIREV